MRVYEHGNEKMIFQTRKEDAFSMFLLSNQGRVDVIEEDVERALSMKVISKEDSRWTWGLFQRKTHHEPEVYFKERLTMNLTVISKKDSPWTWRLFRMRTKRCKWIRCKRRPHEHPSWLCRESRQFVVHCLCLERKLFCSRSQGLSCSDEFWYKTRRWTRRWRTRKSQQQSVYAKTCRGIIKCEYQVHRVLQK